MFHNAFMKQNVTIILFWLQAITQGDNAKSTCILKHTAMATGEKCPANETCISGML